MSLVKGNKPEEDLPVGAVTKSLTWMVPVHANEAAANNCKYIMEETVFYTGILMPFNVVPKFSVFLQSDAIINLMGVRCHSHGGCLAPPIAVMYIML